jgi:hypothetical protein
MKIELRIFPLIGIFIFILSGCISPPSVNNITEEFIPDLQYSEDSSLEKVEKAILSASRKRGWSPRAIKPGLIEARITVRSHRATIEIPYSKNSYSIIYKDSYNLNFKNGTIHRNYNGWVTKLSVAIQKGLYREHLVSEFKTIKPLTINSN